MVYNFIFKLYFMNFMGAVCSCVRAPRMWHRLSERVNEIGRLKVRINAT